MSRWLRIAVATAVAVGIVGLATGCNETKLGDLDEGQTFEMGSLRINVLYDRFLNPSDVEDSGYLQDARLPRDGKEYLGKQDALLPPGGKEYYGVFVLISNQGDHDVPLPLRTGFTITDSTHARYQPVDTRNGFTFPFGQTLGPDEEVPNPDSIAAAGPTQGSLILFLLDQGVNENRPLTLFIRYLGEEADVTLDL